MVTGVVRLGVDFGTSNTAAVVSVDGREARPLLFDGSPLLPSAVCVEQGGRLLAGRDALHTGLANPESLEPYPKRCVDDGTVLLGELEVPVERLIGAVLGRVVEEATRTAGGPVTEAVLTCPAAWGDLRRETLLSAARGILPGVRLVVEPVAAADRLVGVAGDRVPVGSCALVYDFGAGTFDASVLRRTGTGFEVLAAEGLPDSGGLDVDAAVVDHLGVVLARRDPALWERLSAPSTLADRRARRQFWENVRAGKEMLSRASGTQIHVPLLDVDLPLGREELDRLAAPVLDRTVATSRSALRAAGIEPTDLGTVFLVGGSSRMPAVTTVLHRAFGVVPTAAEQPELVVAEGSLLNRPVAGPDAAGRGASPPPAESSWPGGSGPGERGPGERGPGGGGPGGDAAGGDGPGAGWRSRRRLAMLAGAAVLVVVAVPATLVALTDRDRSAGADGERVAAGTASGADATPTPSPTPSLPSWLDPCLIGTWQRTSTQRTMEIDGADTEFTGATGETETYRPDGTMSIEFRGEPPNVAVVKGVRWQQITQGKATANYRVTGDGRLLLTNVKAKGTWKLTRNGRLNNSGKLNLSVKPADYVCTAGTLVEVGEYYAIESRRVRPATTTATTSSSAPADSSPAA